MLGSSENFTECQGLGEKSTEDIHKIFEVQVIISPQKSVGPGGKSTKCQGLGVKFTSLVLSNVQVRNQPKCHGPGVKSTKLAKSR